METIQALTTVLPIAVSSGINLYATILIVGISMRFGLITGVPEMFEILASLPVIIAAGVLYVLEFFADKIQFVDQFWDFLHTFVRPLGAAVIAFAAIGHVDPSLALIAALVSGGAALVSHAGKAGGRVALNTMSPAENVSNIGVSLAEDVFVGVLVVMAIKYPYVAAVIAVIFLILIIAFVPVLLRWSWFNITALFARIKGIVKPIDNTEPLPEHLVSLLPTQPLLSARCRAQGVKGADGRSGYLCFTDTNVYFTYSGWIRSGVWDISQRQVVEGERQEKLLMDILTLRYKDSRNKEHTARFVFTKDRIALLNRFLARVAR